MEKRGEGSFGLPSCCKPKKKRLSALKDIEKTKEQNARLQGEKNVESARASKLGSRLLILLHFFFLLAFRFFSSLFSFFITVPSSSLSTVNHQRSINQSILETDSVSKSSEASGNCLPTPPPPQTAGAPGAGRCGSRTWSPSLAPSRSGPTTRPCSISRGRWPSSTRGFARCARP